MVTKFKNGIDGSDLLVGMGELAYSFCREKNIDVLILQDHFLHHNGCYSTLTTLNANCCSSLVWAKPGALGGLR